MDTASKFSFQYLSGKKFNSIEGKDAKESLVKWYTYIMIFIMKTANIPYCRSHMIQF